jgi:hypothetical protein
MTLPAAGLAELPALWRGQADGLEAYAPPAAVAFRRAADELEAALRDAADEELTLTQASGESNYSTRQLRSLLRNGSIPDAGRRGAPRVRRGDLPRKARPASAPSTYDAGADALRLLSRMG